MPLIIAVYVVFCLELALLIIFAKQAKAFDKKRLQYPQAMKLTKGAKQLLEMEDYQLEEMHKGKPVTTYAVPQNK